MDDDDITLPGGWQWAANVHDIAKGLAASKVWWRKGKPFVRVRLYAIGNDMGFPGTIRGTIEVALAKSQRMQHAAGKSRVKHTMIWEYVMDIPGLPNEPTSAAVCVELDYPQWERTIIDHGAKGGILWCETES